MSKQPSGLVLYKGKSQINGEKIVCILTGLGRKSSNRKTGDLLQTWIIPEKINPVEAAQTGKDNSVCGDCPHRRFHGEFKSCYVNLGQAPLQVWKAHKNGKYPSLSKKNINLLKGRLLRISSYGDPIAIPKYIWDSLLKVVDGHLGYTHGWKYCDQSYSDILMASCDCEEDKLLAESKGWMTFRVRTENQPLLRDEFVCPASDLKGKHIQCADCQACCGTKFGNKKPGRTGTPTIVVHGNLASRFKKVALTIGSNTLTNA